MDHQHVKTLQEDVVRIIVNILHQQIQLNIAWHFQQELILLMQLLLKQQKPMMVNKHVLIMILVHQINAQLDIARIQLNTFAGRIVLAIE